MGSNHGEKEKQYWWLMEFSGYTRFGRKEDTSDGYDNIDSNHRGCFGSRYTRFRDLPQKAREGLTEESSRDLVEMGGVVLRVKTMNHLFASEHA
jgi:hypothetical protein